MAPYVEIVAAAKNEDQEAINSLLIMYEDDLRLIIKSFHVEQEEDIQDLTQEIFIHAFTHLDTLKDDTAFPSWLKELAKNYMIDRYRKNKRSMIMLNIDDHDGELVTENDIHTDVMPSERLEQKTQREIIASLIDELPEIYRNVLIDLYYHNMSYQQIAEKYKININTVKSRLFTAKKKLKANIEAYEHKTNTVLHSADILGQLRTIIRSIYNTKNIGSTMTTVQQLTSAGVSHTISNNLATKISMATASVSLAVTISVVSMGVTVANPPNDTTEESSVVSELSISEEESIESSEEPETTEVISAEPSENVTEPPESTPLPEPSIIYVHETSNVYVPETSYVYVSVPGETSFIERSMNYQNYETVESYDGFCQYLVYPDNNEAMLLNFEPEHVFSIDDPNAGLYFNGMSRDYFRPYDEANYDPEGTPEVTMVLPSYISYNGQNIPVTKLHKNAFENFSDEHYVKSIEWPEHLKEIPDKCMMDFRFKSIGPAKELTRIGLYAFNLDTSELKVLDLANLFPSLTELEEGMSFYSEFTGKVTLPATLLDIPDSVFEFASEVEIHYDQHYPRKRYLKADTFRLILPEQPLKASPLSFLHPSTLDEPENTYLENFYFDSNNHPVTFETEKDNFGVMIKKLSAENMYLPEGLTAIAAHAFDTYDSTTHSVIENLYIPQTITKIEKDAFCSSKGNAINHIFLPKTGKTADELKILKKSVLLSKNFSFEKEEDDYLIFTNIHPEAIVRVNSEESSPDDEFPPDDEDYFDEMIPEDEFPPDDEDFLDETIPEDELPPEEDIFP